MEVYLTEYVAAIECDGFVNGSVETDGTITAERRCGKFAGCGVMTELGFTHYEGLHSFHRPTRLDGEIV